MTKNAPLRAIIYARYSSDHQRQESNKDQVDLCRGYIARQGWRLIGTYDDPAVSGASMFRPGLTRLPTDAEAGKFDVLVCESIDRLSRKLADVAGLFDRLSFRGVQVHTTSNGPINQMLVGFMGTVAQMTLTDLRDKTRRGQLGRARLGKIPGGVAFGYDVVTPAAGATLASDALARKRLRSSAGFFATTPRANRLARSPSDSRRKVSRSPRGAPGSTPLFAGKPHEAQVSSTIPST